MMFEQRNNGTGFLGSARRLAGTVGATLRNRFELLLTELQEERIKLFNALLLIVGIGVCALLAVIMLTITIMLAAGEQHRLLAAGVITAVYVLAALALSWQLKARLKAWSIFSATREELRKDREWLETSRP